MITLALGIEAPEGSVTVPAMPPKTACEKVVTDQVARKSPRITIRSEFFMEFPPVSLSWCESNLFHAHLSLMGGAVPFRNRCCSGILHHDLQMVARAAEAHEYCS